MEFLQDNYSWIVSLLLLALILIQSKKISLLDKKIQELENKNGN